MATKDTSEEDEKLNQDEEVETEQSEDENSTDDDDESTEDTEDDNEEDSDDDDDESETEDDEAEPIKKRFTQFKGDTLEEYTPHLEEAYGNALAEMTRRKAAEKEATGKLDRITTAVAKDPDLAEKLNNILGDESEEVLVDPAILKARQDMTAQMDKEYKEFVDEHPEMESDPILAQEVLDALTDFGKQARKQGKIMGMGDALRKAWVYLGKEDTKEKIATKAKEVASKGKGGGSTNKATGKKPDFTEAQIKYAKRFGLTVEQLAAANKT